MTTWREDLQRALELTNEVGEAAEGDRNNAIRGRIYERFGSAGEELLEEHLYVLLDAARHHDPNAVIKFVEELKR